VKPIRSAHVTTKLLPDGHIVLMSEQTNWAHTLSPLAGIAWEFCDGDLSFEEIVERVCETAGVTSVESIKPELTKLFSELTESGLVSAN
jgi:hypothetical protein